MARYRLGDVCSIVSGSTPRTEIAEYWDGDIKWITPAELNDESYIVTNSMRKLTLLGVQKTGLTSFPAGTVILSSRAPIGKVAIAGCEMYCNQGFKNLICSEKVHNKYLFWFLKGKTEYLNSLGRGATFKEISKQIVGEIEIELPPLEEQVAIARRFEQLNLLLRERRQEIITLDKLIKARFVELFGDLISNNMGFETKLGSEMFKLSNGKFVPENKRLESGIPVYGGNGISWYTDEILCASDTIVVGRVGFQSGNVHLAKGPLWISDNAMYISNLFDDGFDLRFLYAVMEYIDFTRFQDAGDLKKITQKPFMQMQYIKPPLDMQQEYITFVSQVEKSKAVVQNALDKAQLLFDSLMQKYFG